MILRGLASIVVLGLLLIDLMLPSTDIGRRGTEDRVRQDVENTIELGGTLPALELVGFDGRKVSNEDLIGHRVLLTFERSVDW